MRSVSSRAKVNLCKGCNNEVLLHSWLWVHWYIVIFTTFAIHVDIRQMLRQIAKLLVCVDKVLPTAKKFFIPTWMFNLCIASHLPSFVVRKRSFLRACIKLKQEKLSQFLLHQLRNFIFLIVSELSFKLLNDTKLVIKCVHFYFLYPCSVHLHEIFTSCLI